MKIATNSFFLFFLIFLIARKKPKSYVQIILCDNQVIQRPCVPDRDHWSQTPMRRAGARWQFAAILSRNFHQIQNFSTEQRRGPPFLMFISRLGARRCELRVAYWRVKEAFFLILRAHRGERPTTLLHGARCENPSGREWSGAPVLFCIHSPAAFCVILIAAGHAGKKNI